MWYLIISIVLLGIIASSMSLWEKRKRRRMYERGEIESLEEDTPTAVPTECCGQHEMCERDSLLSAVSKTIEYYNDEELDVYRNKPADTYSEKETEEFREVLYTLREDEVAGWMRSLQLRGICLPEELKDEALLIVEERRMGVL